MNACKFNTGPSKREEFFFFGTKQRVGGGIFCCQVFLTCLSIIPLVLTHIFQCLDGGGHDVQVSCQAPRRLAERHTVFLSPQRAQPRCARPPGTNCGSSWPRWLSALASTSPTCGRWSTSAVPRPSRPTPRRSAVQVWLPLPAFGGSGVGEEPGTWHVRGALCEPQQRSFLRKLRTSRMKK